MSVALACTWRPRGEMPRFEQAYPHLKQVYADLIIAVPGEIDPADLDAVQAVTGNTHARVAVSPDRTGARYLALQTTLDTSADFVHYVDMDRLLRWLETRPDELRHTVESVQTCDCLIIGRTEAAFQTHPQALQKTESIVNEVFSFLFGRRVDVCSGSKGFSRRAVELIVAHSKPGHWSDAEWPMLAQRAGLNLDAIFVDGLDWETADHFQAQAANAEAQRRLAEEHDRDAEHWAFRAQAALDIVREGLAATKQSQASQETASLRSQ